MRTRLADITTVVALFLAMPFFVTGERVDKNGTEDTLSGNPPMAVLLEKQLIAIDKKFQSYSRKAAVLGKKIEHQYYLESIAPDVVLSAHHQKALLLYRVPTKKPVVFLTIDDGIVKDPKVLDYVDQHRLNPTLFLTLGMARNNYDFFLDWQGKGYTIQNHTVNHPILKNMSLDAQANEICAASNLIEKVYTTKPKMLRPPTGEFNDNTLIAAKRCGIDYVIHWTAVIDNQEIAYAQGNKLRAGDIVLLHFRTNLKDDLMFFIQTSEEHGLVPANLSDWLD